MARMPVFDEHNVRLVGDFLSAGDLVVLVTPIDSAAPKGRMILPQQQVLRDVLDSDAAAVVVKENGWKKLFRLFRKSLLSLLLTVRHLNRCLK